MGRKIVTFHPIDVEKVIQILFGFLLFVFPFSIRFLVYEANTYRFGHFNPWVSEFIYLPEVLLVIVFGLWVFHKGFLRSVEMTKRVFPVTLITLFVLNALLVTFWQGDAVLGFFWVWRVLEAGMLSALVAGRVLEPPKMIRILLWGALFQLALGLLQWKLNHSVGLSLLGEPVIGPEVLNVAKMDLADGLKQIRPYGTMLHPNILAAYFLVILFAALDVLKPSQKLPWLVGLGFGIYFTQSLAVLGVAVIALGLWLLFSFLRNAWVRRGLVTVGFLALALVSVWFFIKSDQLSLAVPSFEQRLEQNVISQVLFTARPLGVGTRNFTLEMEGFSERKLQPWEFQPVHNTYFLILNETGAQGLLLLLALIALVLYSWRHGKAIPLLSLLLLAPFDHFLWDSFAGMMLVALAAGFFALENKSA